MSGTGLSNSNAQSNPIVATAANQGIASATGLSAAQNSSGIQSLLSQYASGGISLQDALSAAQAGGGGAGAQQYQTENQQLQDQINQMQSDPTKNAGAIQTAENQIAQNNATISDIGNDGGQALQNAIAGNGMAATDEAQQLGLSSPALAGDFGQGGLLSQAQNQYTTSSNNLASDYQSLMGNDQSYGLTQNDLAAYGQAAGNIARDFGGAQESLQTQLANRGMSAGDSGVAQQGFSNLYGNQNEQLAGLQTQIATNRINTAQQLATTRAQTDLQQQGQASNTVQGLGSLGNSAVQNEYNDILASAGLATNNNAVSANLGLNSTAQTQNTLNASNSAYQSSLAPSIGTQLATGALSSLTGAATGALGTAAGGSLGSALGLTVPQNTAGTAGTVSGLGGSSMVPLNNTQAYSNTNVMNS